MHKTIQHGAATIHIHRPDLDGMERAKREQEIRTTLEHALREYITRKEKTK